MTKHERMKPADLQAGMGRATLNAWAPGKVMLGWGQPRNKAERVETPLACRALALRDDEGATFVYLVAELCFISERLRDAVVERLAGRGVDPALVMLSATHNHSGPGGYSEDFWFDIPSGGFSPEVFAGLVDGIVAAAEQALDALQPAAIRWHEGATDLASVCINRSWKATSRNPEVPRLTRATAARGVDPRMQVLRVDAADGRPLGLVSWFGLHGTSHRADSTVIRPDNKGTAARAVEAALGDDFVAIFAQGHAGDVTSNARPGRLGLGRRGPEPTDEASCRRVAEAQARAARQLFEDAPARGLELSGPIAGAIERATLAERDLGRTPDGRARRTAAASLGAAMSMGTAEGPGPLRPLRPAFQAAALVARQRWRIRRLLDREHPAEPRVPLVEPTPEGSATIFRRFDFMHPLFPAWVDRELSRTRRALKAGELDAPWLPDGAPAQVVRVGPLAFAAVAGEPTTVAGQRLRRRLEAELGLRVQTCTYANGYTGYVVTEHEYLEQDYEAGSTLYGRDTLEAWCQSLTAVGRRVVNESVGVAPGGHSATA